MRDWLHTLYDYAPEFSARSIFDILLLAALIYLVLRFARNTVAMSLLRGGILVFAALFIVANRFGLFTLQWLLDNVASALITVVAVIFQPEIRRTLERLGRTRVTNPRSRSTIETQLIEILARAARSLSTQRHGALIVVERETGLEEYISTGRRLDAIPSEELIGTVFFHNSPLHDGALIVRGDRLVAAGCLLPLTDTALSSALGTRHRAGVGITERSDAVVMVVSEETGDISVAVNGQLARQLDDGRLRELLTRLLNRDERGRALTVRRESDVATISSVKGREALP